MPAVCACAVATAIRQLESTSWHNNWSVNLNLSIKLILVWLEVPAENLLTGKVPAVSQTRVTRVDQRGGNGWKSVSRFSRRF